MQRSIFQPMKPMAIEELVLSVKVIVAKHHRDSDDVAQMVDYAAVATLALLDMGLQNLPQAERVIEFKRFEGNIRRMSERVASDGFAGLIGGTILPATD